MEFMFSNFWTFPKVLIDVIFVSNTYKFCLIVIIASQLYALNVSITIILC